MKANQNILFFHEEIMLLALREEEGTIATGTMYQYAIGGAILSELLMRERICIDKSKNKKLVNLISATQIGEPIIDECLEKIRTVKRPASLQMWISRFASIKNLKNRVAEQLCKRGILRVDEDKILLLFTRKLYPEVNPKPEKDLIERLRVAIFTDSKAVDARTIVLISLANSAGLLKIPFDKKLLKGRKERIEQIVNGDLIGKAAKEVIAAIQAAVMVAVIVPAVTTAVNT